MVKKIASLVLNSIKVDYAILNMEQMTFARILIEVPIYGDYPKMVLF